MAFLDVKELFRKPSGPLGPAAGWIMANKKMGPARNRWTIDLLDVQPGDRVLELGCGPGLGLSFCADKLRAGQVVGLDHSAAMLKQARRRNRVAMANDRVVLVEGGLGILTKLPGPFDKIYSVNVMQFFDDMADAFARLRTVAAPGATIASTYVPPLKGMTREDGLQIMAKFEDGLRKADWSQMQRHELPFEPVSALCLTARNPH